MKFSILLCFSIAILSLTSHLASADVPQMPEFLAAEYHFVASVVEIPEPMLGILRRLDREPGIVDPGQPFSDSCVGARNVPRRRLSFAGHLNGRWLVH